MILLIQKAYFVDNKFMKIGKYQRLKREKNMRYLFLICLLVFISNADASSNPFEQFEGCYRVATKRCWFENRELACPYTNVWLYKRVEQNDVTIFFPLKNKGGFNSCSGMIEFDQSYGKTRDYAYLEQPNVNSAKYSRLIIQPKVSSLVRQVFIEQVGQDYIYSENDGGIQFQSTMRKLSRLDECY